MDTFLIRLTGTTLFENLAVSNKTICIRLPSDMSFSTLGIFPEGITPTIMKIHIRTKLFMDHCFQSHTYRSG